MAESKPTKLEEATQSTLARAIKEEAVAEVSPKDVIAEGDYKQLLADCTKICNEFIRTAHESLILAKWRLGIVIRSYEEKGILKIEYSQATLKRLAKDLGISYSTLYRCRQFATHELFQTEEAVKRFIAKMSKEIGKPVTWFWITEHALPAKPSTQDKSPARVDEDIDWVLFNAEKLAHKVEEATLVDIPESRKDEIEGVLLYVDNTVHSALRELRKEAGVSVEAIRNHDIESQYGCVVCKEAYPEVVKLYEGGDTGEAGVYVGLCRKHRAELNSIGADSFVQKYAKEFVLWFAEIADHYWHLKHKEAQ